MNKNELNPILLKGESDLDACLEYQHRMDKNEPHPKDKKAYDEMNCRKRLCEYHFDKHRELRDQISRYANNPHYNTFFLERARDRHTENFKKLGCHNTFTYKDVEKRKKR